MPLNWDSADTVLDTTDESDLALREAGIFATMAVGINHITEDNCLTFYKRVSLYERAMGAYRFQSTDEGSVPLFMSPEDVVRLIGLRTNAAPKTQTQFNKFIWEAHERWVVPWGFKMPLDRPVES